MRSVWLCALLLLAAAAAPASASSLHVKQDNARGSLSWYAGKDALVLGSAAGKGVHVVDAVPAGLFGLRKGDEILAVDGQPVDSISGLLDALHASKAATAQLSVSRNGSRQVVTVAVKDYERFMPPVPPPPPPPPPPPVSG